MYIPKELIEFATDISENYLTQKPADYISKGGKGKYTLEFIKGRPKKNDYSYIKSFSVGNKQGHFILYQEDALEHSKDFIFYMVIWMGIHRKMFGKYEATDRHALKYYKTTKRSLNALREGFQLTILRTKTSETALNKRRMENSYNLKDRGSKRIS